MDIKCEGTCNNNGIDNTYSVTIPRDRYEELIDMETRADVLINVARREKFIDLDVVLIILGELPLGGDK